MPAKGYIRGNVYIIKEDHAVMVIQSKTYGRFDVLVDLDDVERLKEQTWGIHRSHGAHTPVFRVENRNANAVHSSITNFIIKEVPSGMVVDHKHHDACDLPQSKFKNMHTCTKRNEQTNL